MSAADVDLAGLEALDPPGVPCDPACQRPLCTRCDLPTDDEIDAALERTQERERLVWAAQVTAAFVGEGRAT